MASPDKLGIRGQHTIRSAKNGYRPLKLWYFEAGLWLFYISLDILRAVFIRSFFKPLVSYDTDLGSFPTFPPVASFNAWSRFKGFFLSTLIIVYIIYSIVNRLVHMGGVKRPICVHSSKLPWPPTCSKRNITIHLIMASEPFFFIWSWNASTIFIVAAFFLWWML